MLDWKSQLAGINPAGDASWLESYLREWQDSRDAEVQKALIALVETLDELNRLAVAIEEHEPSNAWSEPLRVLRSQLRRRLVELGLQPIPTQGQLVDPKVHNVVETVEGGGPPASIVRELRAGYVYRDQLLRAAWVVSVRSDGDGRR